MNGNLSKQGNDYDNGTHGEFLAKDKQFLPFVPYPDYTTPSFYPENKKLINCHGFELFGAEEKKEVNDVLETGIYMRYGFDGPRKGIWKAKELEQAALRKFNVKYAQLTSSGHYCSPTAMAALAIGAGDEVIAAYFHFVASFEARAFRWRNSRAGR